MDKRRGMVEKMKQMIKKIDSIFQERTKNNSEKADIVLYLDEWEQIKKDTFQ